MFRSTTANTGTETISTYVKYHVISSFAKGAQSLTVGDDVKKSTTTNYDVANTRTLYIFARNDNGTVKYYSSARLYSMKIYSDADKTGTLLRDFYPCYRRSDGVAGLYDMANQVFYPNSGTGVFTIGDKCEQIL